MRDKAFPAMIVVSAAVLCQRVEAQCMESKLTPGATCIGPASCWFGWSVDIEGSDLVVGAPGSKKVFAYRKSGGVWSEQQVLGEPQLEGFAVSLDVTTEWLAIGANGDSTFGFPDAGSVLMYRLVGGTWVLHQKVIPSDPHSLHGFGGAVDINGADLVVGAASDGTTPGGKGAGAAYFFELQGGMWVETQKVFASDGAADRRFGDSVALSGSRCLIGAPGFDPFGQGPLIGKVYAFEHAANGDWKESQVLESPSGQPGGEFGSFGAVSVQGDWAIVGEHFARVGTEMFAGAAYVYNHDGQKWEPNQRLIAKDHEAGAEFGSSVCLDNLQVVIGARRDSDLGVQAGAAYFFAHTGTQWEQAGKLIAPDGLDLDGLAFTGVALSNGVSALGAIGVDDDCGLSSPDCDSGATYLFDVSSSVVQYCSCTGAGPCGNGDDHGGCANSTGQGGVLQACGAASIAIDDIRMEARWLPKDCVGLVMMGSTAAIVTLGNGQLCLGAGGTGIFRFGPTSSGSDGVLSLGPGIIAYTHANFPPAGQIQAGDTWYFQTWYRDPSGPCGTGFNLTNGLKVEFTQ